jgi:hypothetical protein
MAESSSALMAGSARITAAAALSLYTFASDAAVPKDDPRVGVTWLSASIGDNNAQNPTNIHKIDFMLTPVFSKVKFMIV